MIRGEDAVEGDTAKLSFRGSGRHRCRTVAWLVLAALSACSTTEVDAELDAKTASKDVKSSFDIAPSDAASKGDGIGADAVSDSGGPGDGAQDPSGSDGATKPSDGTAGDLARPTGDGATLPPLKAVPVASLLAPASPVAAGSSCKPGCTVSVKVVEGGEVSAGSTVHLQADVKCGSAPVTQYTWTPKGPGCPELIPGAFTPWPTVSLDHVGHYEFCVEAVAVGPGDVCGKVCVSANALPTAPLHVELSWATPGDADQCNTGPGAGADLDLHALAAASEDPIAPPCPAVASSWGDPKADVFWGAQGPDWPPEGLDGDGKLIRDDSDGSGPEILTVASPSKGTTLTLGVHYPDDSGFGCSTATLRIFTGGPGAMLVGSVQRVLAPGDFWGAARLHWKTSGPVAEPCGALGQSCSGGAWWTAGGACIVPCATVPGTSTSIVCTPSEPRATCP
jgi:hypothetical protein